MSLRHLGEVVHFAMALAECEQQSVQVEYKEIWTLNVGLNIKR